MTLDLAASNCQIRSVPSLRSFFITASKAFTNLNWLKINVCMARQGIGSPLKQLMRDGTFQNFSQLESVRVEDRNLAKKFRAYDQQSKALIRAKIVEWTTLRCIDQSLSNSELLITAGCMARMETLNLRLKDIMKELRKDSALLVECYEE